jgi:hypothetical protein
VLYPLIGPRLHGWLDELVALLYVVGALVLGLTGAARIVAFGGALVHFTLTRLTKYPQGTWKVIPFRTHAFIELSEGVVVLATTLVVLGEVPFWGRAFLILMGLSQFVAFAFSDYGLPGQPAASA